MLNMHFLLKRLRGEPVTQFVLRVLTGIAFGAAFWGIYFWAPIWVFSVTLAAVAAIIVLFEWKNLYNPHKIYFWLFLPIYPILPFVLLICLNTPHYRILILYLFLLAFAHDTAAYIVGSLFGYHKICPSISPKKTWEGALGGFCAAVITLEIVLRQRGGEPHVLFVLVCALAASFVFVVGDLIESRMKRKAGVKDSGTLLPGHGGFLDRFDGIMFAAFFVFLFRNYLVVLLS